MKTLNKIFSLGKKKDSALTPTDSIDLDYALQLMDQDKEILQIACRAILRDLPTLLTSLEEPLHSASDISQISRAAHSIKGIARTFNATQTATIAKTIEQALDMNDLASAEKELPSLRKLIGQLTLELENKLPDI